MTGETTMEDNRKFELNDDQLDEVAGGFAVSDDQSVTYNGMTFSVGQAVEVPYCSASGCGGSNCFDAVITGFGSTREELLKSGEVTVYLQMDCCKKNAQHSIKRLMPYRPTTRN